MSHKGRFATLETLATFPVAPVLLNLFMLTVIPTVLVHYSKFARYHFYNFIKALPSLVYFQISFISVLEINLEIVSKRRPTYSCIIFSFLHFLKTCIKV